MWRTRRQQRGIVAVIVALAILSLLAMAGLAIDMGHLVLNKSRLQSTVDAAALAGAKVLDETQAQHGGDGSRRHGCLHVECRQVSRAPRAPSVAPIVTVFEHAESVRGGQHAGQLRAREGREPSRCGPPSRSCSDSDDCLHVRARWQARARRSRTRATYSPWRCAQTWRAGAPYWGYVPYGKPATR